MEDIKALKLLIYQAENHHEDFLRKDNVRASVRCRKLLREIIRLARYTRMEIKKNNAVSEN